jgi:Flp pilus assembly protein TadG
MAIRPFRLRFATCRRDRSGAVAVEFALVGPVFFLLLLMTIELGIVLLTQSVLDFATQDAARLIALGQAAAKGTFTARLCTDTAPLIPCASLQVNVQAAATFNGFSPTVQTDGNGNLTNTQYSPGSSGQSVIVQVGYNSPYVSTWVGTLLGNNNASLLVSSVAFQNEPY